jgi:GDP-4-dehydro-6-deoxy-D-mannose reductase
MTGASPYKRVLITGVAGSGGSYLAEYLLEHQSELEVYGFSRWHSTTALDNLAAVRERIHLFEVDLMALSSVLNALEQAKPDVIFHLAAHANVRASFITPNSVLANNILGTSNLFEAIRLLRLDPVIQLCSTSEVYGQIDPKHVPVKEDAPMQPASPYAVSKIAQDMLGWTYFVAYKMRVIRTRMFAYLNPRRADLFATSFAKQVAWIELGLQQELVHGNLNSLRTLLDVRDAMRAYWEAVLHCEPGEVYNIGGTTVMTVGEFLDRLIALSHVPIPTRCDPALLRPADVTLQIPCVDKFTRATGWRPAYSFDDSIEFLLGFWRVQAQQAAGHRLVHA